MLSPPEIKQKKEIEELYCGKKLSYRKVANQLGLSETTVFRRIRQFGIPTRNLKEAIKSRHCYLRMGQENNRWTGGRYRSVYGYVVLNILLLSEEDKCLCKSMFYENGGNKTIFEHRLIMARQLGRALKTSELVHHLNGIKDDNRLENLFLLNQTKHREVIPIMQGRMKELERRLKICESG